MAVWGRYGGRLLKKSSMNGRDCPISARYLLERGADVNILDSYGVTPLGTACGTGSPDCIDLLVSHGAKVNQQFFDGTTALHECFYRGNIDCLQKLLQYKPNTTILDKRSHIPLHAAFIDDMDGILEYVLGDEGHAK